MSAMLSKWLVISTSVCSSPSTVDSIVDSMALALLPAKLLRMLNCDSMALALLPALLLRMLLSRPTEVACVIKSESWKPISLAILL